MNNFYLVMKTLLVSLCALLAAFNPVVGGMMFPVGEGSTRVFLDWHGQKSDCLVTVVSGD